MLVFNSYSKEEKDGKPINISTVNESIFQKVSVPNVEISTSRKIITQTWTKIINYNCIDP